MVVPRNRTGDERVQRYLSRPKVQIQPHHHRSERVRRPDVRLKDVSAIGEQSDLGDHDDILQLVVQAVPGVRYEFDVAPIRDHG